MTEQNIQDAITALYESTAVSPATTDDDYLTRRSLMNTALRRWEKDPGFFWNELWTQDTSKTVIAAQSSYLAPTNFVRAGGFVRLINSSGQTAKKYPVVSPSDAQVKSDSECYAYFTGSPNDATRTLHLNPAPVSTDSFIGYTIKYDYYKAATPYTAAGIISEIPDAQYIVFSVVSELHKADHYATGYSTAVQEAEERLKGMEVAQFTEVNYQDNTIYDETNTGFGV